MKGEPRRTEPAEDAPDRTGAEVQRRHLPGHRPEYRAVVVFARAGKSQTLTTEWLDLFEFRMEWAALQRRFDEALMTWFRG